MDKKSSLREYFLELLRKQGSKERLNKSLRIAEQLFALPEVQKAETILFYASLPGEVDTFAMMKQAIQLKKRIALPVIMRDQRKMIPTLTDSLEDLEGGAYGISQPRLSQSNAVDIQCIDAVIVPGLAFDKANNRLGRGAGYYDRFLSGLPISTAKIGIAFDFQIVDRLPTEEHDVPLHSIIAA